MSHAWPASCPKWQIASHPGESFGSTGGAEGLVADARGLRQTRCDRRSAPLFSHRSLVPESVERERIDDPTGEVGAVSREPLDHEAPAGIFGCGEMKPSALASSKPKRG